ncbi:hypothetical protein ACOZ4I_09335 [Haloarcula salina]
MRTTDTAIVLYNWCPSFETMQKKLIALVAVAAIALAYVAKR